MARPVTPRPVNPSNDSGNSVITSIRMILSCSRLKLRVPIDLYQSAFKVNTLYVLSLDKRYQVFPFSSDDQYIIGAGFHQSVHTAQQVAVGGMNFQPFEVGPVIFTLSGCRQLIASNKNLLPYQRYGLFP